VPSGRGGHLLQYSLSVPASLGAQSNHCVRTFDPLHRSPRKARLACIGAGVEGAHGHVTDRRAGGRVSRKLRLYLDTSVWSFAFAEDAPQYRDATREFFRLASEGRFDLFGSSIVRSELNRTNNLRLREAMAKLYGNLPVRDLEVTPEAEELAGKYLQAGVLPPKSLNDALHVALATVSDVAIVLSWNFKHLANVDRNDRFRSVNLLEGYRLDLRIVNPLEVQNADS
jgi:predicted nucleic acid-binding protein